MKRIYFVRHGETISNVEELIQGLGDPLTEEGERQARIVAARVKDLKIDALISSDALRAHETAKAIAQETGLSIELSPLFRENKRPTSLEGKRRGDEECVRYYAEKDLRAHEYDWRFEDEENYSDFITRGAEALRYLEGRPEEDIMVVTHGHFLRCMLMTMVMGDGVTPQVWDAFAKGFAITNTAITVGLYDGDRWRVLTWNDHAHFAE
jgi:broad specificity phosphatase PhoE